jgi:hypothetical protein
VNYEILMSKDRKNCMCTAMLYILKTIMSQKKQNNISKKRKCFGATDELQAVEFPEAFAKKVQLR